MVASAEEFFPPTWSGLCWLGWGCHYCFTCSQNELNCKTVRNYGILRIKTQTKHTFWIFLGTRHENTIKYERAWVEVNNFQVSCLTKVTSVMTNDGQGCSYSGWESPPLARHWLCSHGLESCFERRFRTSFGPFLIWKPDFSPCERKAVSNQAFETHFETRKKDILDRDPPRKPDSRTCERRALSEHDLCVCIFGNARSSHAEAMHGSISADCAVWTKYYVAVRRSWSWLGRRLQCMWTHVVQITISITFWIAIQTVFRNVILAHVNTAFV